MIALLLTVAQSLLAAQIGLFGEYGAGDELLPDRVRDHYIDACSRWGGVHDVQGFWVSDELYQYVAVCKGGRVVISTVRVKA